MSGSPLPEAKVIFVGPPAVGKTTLSTVLLGRPFESNVIPTTAPMFACHTVSVDSDHEVSLHFWDTAGHERFQAITKPFYRDADIAVVCYIPSQSNVLESWASRVLEVVPECHLVYVVTQCDKYTREELADDAEATKDFGLSHGSRRFVTSAKTGEGVSVLLDALAQTAFSQYQGRQGDGGVRGSGVGNSAAKAAGDAGGCC
jgi:small GTP-binding protein